MDVCICNRWEAFAEMASLFYTLHDAYQAMLANQDVSLDAPMSEEMCETCKLAGEVQRKFNCTGVEPRACQAKLLSFLEADCIPVRLL